MSDKPKLITTQEERLEGAARRIARGCFFAIRNSIKEAESEDVLEAFFAIAFSGLFRWEKDEREEIGDTGLPSAGCAQK